DNLIFTGRMISADKSAFGAVRVMINLNQLGEAAGTAAYLALNSNIPLHLVSSTKLRKTLSKGGSIIL
ncbi:MAG TPA: FAD-dependent oxidoreductase, partial [Victivallales bacterium]|nr:FAD-dependent oxidoreductase [Victivallales bacterium]